MNEYYFKTPFGESGDRDPIPRPVQGDGSVSYAQGWGPDYQKSLKTQATAKAVSRKATNQVMYAVTQALGQYQRQGVPGFITAADNDGAAFPYGLGAEVIHNGQYWVSLQANNTTTPGTGNGWQTVLYRVATDTEVNEGTDSRTFIVPSNLKPQLDARDKTINKSIETLAQTVAQNKTDQGKINQATDETISQNKKDADAAIKKINDDFSSYKASTDQTIANLTQRVANLEQTVGQLRESILSEVAQEYVTEIRFGSGKIFRQRNGDRNELLTGGAMTSWGDSGSSNYSQTLRLLEFSRNGQWVQSQYVGGISEG